MALFRYYFLKINFVLVLILGSCYVQSRFLQYRVVNSVSSLILTCLLVTETYKVTLYVLWLNLSKFDIDKTADCGLFWRTIYFKLEVTTF